ncbi:N2,N2-dimethylguanosine tRNA methyltransferase [Paramyrothecium foliicola]|nr:N2,N2-dimethylguanosine tRNA methyltransferase [Paramyrothecium foliicola]
MPALPLLIRQASILRACNPALRTLRNPATSIAPCSSTIVILNTGQVRLRSASKNWKLLRSERAERTDVKKTLAAFAVQAKKAAYLAPKPPVPQRMLSEVVKDGKSFQTVTEGKATILIPEGAKIGEDTREVQQVFYNPIQQYNRDLSVLAIKAFGEELIEKREAARLQRANRKTNPSGSKRKRRAEEPQDSKRTRTDEPQATLSEAAARAIIEGAELPAEDDAAPKTDAGPEAEIVKEQQTEAKEQKAPEPQFTILDALSASGLRALRYAHEIPFVTQIKANDLSASAAQSIQSNVDHNGLQDKITVTNEDALALMYRAIADGLSNRDHRGYPTRGGKFDVIDLDPYGTAAPFLDAAVQAVRDNGGLLCITCTDSAVWAGHSYAEKTFALYGGLPVKGLHSHEAGLRLILNAVATSAARYGLNIEPQLSLSIDFYTKLFIKVEKSPNAVKFLASKTMIVYNCDHGCSSWETQPLMRSQKTPNVKGNGFFYKYIASQGPTADRNCRFCGHKMHITGPMYAGRIHSNDFIKRILAQIPEADPAVYGTLTRLEGMLKTALDEQGEDFLPPTAPTESNPSQPQKTKDDEHAIIDRAPFYIVPAKLAHVLYCQTPPDDMFKGALMHLGYRATRSHCRAGSIKTDAPWPVIWRIMTEWVRQKSPISPTRLDYLAKMPQRPAYKILTNGGITIPKPEEVPADGGNGKDESAANEKAAGKGHKGEKIKDKKGKPQSAEEEEDEFDRMDVSGYNVAEADETLIFDENLAKLGRTKEPRLVRYQANPEPNWGPLTKAKRQ